MPIVLVIKEKGDVHSVLLTAKPIVLGRSSSSDVRLSDDKVSGKHLALKLNSQGRVMVKDLGTTNGSHLNGAQISESYFMLADQLTIGDVELSLDSSQMNPKERKLLTRDDAPTKIKYIRLPGDTGSRKQKQERRPKQEQEQEQEQSSKEVPDERPNDTSDDKTKSSLSERKLINSAKKVAHDRGDSKSYGLPESQFEMEQSTGDTKMLKVSVKNKSQQGFKKSVKKNKQNSKKNESFFSKVLNIIKRD